MTRWAKPAQEPCPLKLSMPTDCVDIWRVRLDAPSGPYVPADILSADEMARGNGFRFAQDRHYFTQCRVALRVLLAAYLSVPGSAIELHYDLWGKPQVAARQNPQGLEFNVSHCLGVALIGFCRHRRLGVDVERVHHDKWVGMLAQRFFSARERQALDALPDDRRTDGFFACWTRKEAFLKATGRGFSFPLSGFSVTADPDRAPRLEEISGDQDAAEQWSLADIRLGHGWRAAAAIEGLPLLIQTHEWNPSSFSFTRGELCKSWRAAKFPPKVWPLLSTMRWV